MKFLDSSPMYLRFLIFRIQEAPMTLIWRQGQLVVRLSTQSSQKECGFTALKVRVASVLKQEKEELERDIKLLKRQKSNILTEKTELDIKLSQSSMKMKDVERQNENMKKVFDEKEREYERDRLLRSKEIEECRQQIIKLLSENESLFARSETTQVPSPYNLLERAKAERYPVQGVRIPKKRSSRQILRSQQ